MKRWIAALMACLLVFGCAVTASADGGNVIYSGTTQDFVFQPGSDYSLTDLFPDFKGVMPGDTLTQTVTVRNAQSRHVKVEIYIRSLGAHGDSKAFLSQLGLRVQKSGSNTMAYMFDAYASETAQLSDWVCLGMLYSGGEVNLDVILEVPTTLDNKFQNAVGYLDWEFMAIEYPVEPSDPEPPKTGDDRNPIAVAVLMGASAVTVIVILLILRKKRRDGDA